MYFGTVEKHRINTKLQLAKVAREQYTHSSIPIFPNNYRAEKVVLIVSEEVIEHYAAILLTNRYDFIICASTFSKLPEGTQKMLDKYESGYIFFEDCACTETSGAGLEAVLRYARGSYPEMKIQVLTESNLTNFTEPFPELRDIVHSRVSVDPRDEHAGVFKAHYDNLDYLHRTGRIIRGTLIVSSVDNTMGEVMSTNARTIVRGGNLNRGMHGDEVYIEGDQIVGIHKRKQRVIVGTLCQISNGWGLIKPLDRKLPDLVTRTTLGQEYAGRKVSTFFIEWPASSELPRVAIFDIRGRNANLEDELDAITAHFGIGYANDTWLDTLNMRREEAGLPVFHGERDLCGVGEPSNQKHASDDRTATALGFKPEDYCIEVAYKEVEEGKRLDLRHLNVCSIDPIGCTDIDDALHCEDHGDYIEVGVHIADVSLYVKPDSILDKEARFRSTTVYFPDRRIDMLPSFLSADLCSLHEGKDRAAFSCIWKLSRDYTILETKMCRSVICSKGSLSYEQAYDVVREMPGAVDKNCIKSINLLMAIATELRRRRFEDGALELSTQEIYMDANKTIKMKESIPTHYLVEEFMLLANISVAGYIYKYNPEYSLLRKHPLPSAIDLEFVDCSSSKAINTSLSKINPENLTIVKRIITRSMQQALYFPSGESSDFYHYGLATEIYTHFTSPIRRYPDIVVHRTLAYILDANEDAIDSMCSYVTNKACSFMNYRHRNAQAASRMVSSLYLFTALTPKPMDATVVAARDGGYVIFIQEYGIEEFVHLKGEYKVFDKVRVSFDTDLETFCTTWKINFFQV